MMLTKRNSTILIAGGAGYIGSHVNQLLARRGYRTVVFDNLSHGHRSFVKWGAFVKGDLADQAAIVRCIKRHHVTAVMHFCSYIQVGESVIDPLKYYRNNVANTINLLEAMRQTSVQRFIFSSTAAVYGNPVTDPITERHPQAPINPYGHSKLMVEQMLADAGRAYGIRYVSLRYFNAAGADPEAEIGEWHDPETHLIPLVLQAALGTRKDVRIYGSNYDTPDGTCVRDYIHVCDLAQAHLLALQYLDKGGGSDAFNLGNGRGFSVRQVIDAARAVTGRPIRVTAARRRAGDAPVLVSGSAKARRVVGWNPRYADLRTIIATAWNWHRKNE